MVELQNNIPPHRYQTSETPLAAYLISIGFKEIEPIEYEDHRAIFTFEESEALAQSVHDFHVVKAIGNIVAFENARRNLIRRIKRELP